MNTVQKDCTFRSISQETEKISNLNTPRIRKFVPLTTVNQPEVRFRSLLKPVKFSNKRYLLKPKISPLAPVLQNKHKLTRRLKVAKKKYPLDLQPISSDEFKEILSKRRELLNSA